MKKLGTDNEKNENEVKTILADTKQNVEDAGVILDDAELSQASGGSLMSVLYTLELTPSQYLKWIFHKKISDARRHQILMIHQYRNNNANLRDCLVTHSA